MLSSLTICQFHETRRMEIMKLFKKALLATAVFGAMGAQAATINNETFKLSKEGVALGVAAQASEFFLDVKVDKDHPSGSIITLTFDDKVDISSVAAAANGEVDQSVGDGVAQSGNVFFDYGTGSFTFDDVKITQADEDDGTPASISFKVNLGNPLTANSAFRIALFNDADADGAFDDGEELVKVSGVSTVEYKSVASANDDTVIDTGSVQISEVASQFAFSVTEKLNELIKRDDLTTFINDTTTDSLAYTYTNDETMLLALQAVETSITFAGNFKGVEDAAVAADTLSVVVDATTDAEAVDVVQNSSSVTTAVVSTHAAAAASKNVYKAGLDFENGSNGSGLSVEIPATGDVKATVVVTGTTSQTEAGTGVELGSNGYTLFSEVEAGEWAIDATIINVPYLPINATGTQSFIHFANETDEDVDVIVTAIDGNGNEYGPMDLGLDLPANTVYKLSMPAIDTLFSLEGASTKLSVTFNIDADKGDVNAYAVSQNDKGRTEVSTSQQRGN